MSASTEEKTPSTLLQPLSGKALREAKVTEALAFMPSALLALINVYDKSLDEETNLLTHAMRGEQEQAEAMLTINPDLALEKGSITDLSNRTFTDITAFQYALWALDWHLWKMLLKYMPSEVAAMQLRELEDFGTAYGRHFNLRSLIEANGLHWHHRVEPWALRSA